RRNGDDLLVRIGELRQRLAKIFGVGRSRRGRGFAAFDFVLPQAMELVRLGDRRFVALSLLGQDVEQDRLVLALEKFEGLDQEWNVMAIDRPVIAQAQFFKDYARQEQVLHALLEFVGELDRALAGNRFNKAPGLVVQTGIGWVRDDVVQITGDGADVLGNRPFVVVQDDDKTARL